MAKTIDVMQLPEDLAALLSSDEKPVFLERNGRPVGVVVSPDTYRRWEQRSERLFAVMDRVAARNRDKAEEKVEADIEQAIREVRAG